MDRSEIIKEIDRERKEARILSLRLENYRGGCSHQYEEITTDLTNQIIAKHDRIKHLCAIVYSEEPKRSSPLQVLLIIVFIISLIAKLVSK